MTDPQAMADRLAGMLRTILSGGSQVDMAAAEQLLAEYATYTRSPVVSIRAQDELRNVAYVTIRGSRVSCTLADGTPAALSYAGVPHGMETEIRLRLENAGAAEALTALQAVGRKGFEYTLFAK